MLLLVLLAALPARATEGDTLRPFVETSLGYDTNLFRFASDAEAQSVPAIAEPIRSLTYKRLGAGLDVDWKLGRQQVIGRLAANNTRFSRYSKLLDYSGHDMKGEWKWQWGNRWSGSLLMARDYARVPYADNTNNTIGTNLKSDDILGFQADYWFHSDWRARLRLDQFKRSYDEGTQKSRNFRRKTATAGLYRLGGTLERLGVEFARTQREFQDRPPTLALDNRYDEDAFRLVGSWNPSGKTALEGQIGYARRSHANFSSHDFSGMEWRFTGRWLPTGKSLMEATLLRNLGEAEIQGVDFNQVDALNLAASWQVLPKTRLIGQARFERDAFEGSTRRDDVISTTLSASHAIWPGSEIGAGWQYSKRSSNIAAYEYKANTLFVSANLKF